MRRSVKPPELRFWAKVRKDGTIPAHRPELGPCWIWTGSKMTSGYGTFSIRGKTLGAHRFAYESARMEIIPEDMDIDHLCHPGDGSCPGGKTDPHRLCVNPDHLEPVSHRENVRRGISFFAVNMAATHCPRGHEYTPENTRIRVGRYGHENRSCKECGKKPAVKKRGWHNSAKTHCPHGHEYTEDNTFFDKSSNGRKCKTCMAMRRVARSRKPDKTV